MHIEKKIALLISDLVPLAEKPDRIGSNARALIAVLPAYARWIEMEKSINRQLKAEAAATVAANLLMLTIGNLFDRRDHAGVLDSTLAYVGKTAADGLSER